MTTNKNVLDACRELKVGRTIKLFDCEWLIEGIHLGELGQESLVQIKSMTHKPGWTGEWEYHPMMFVPEPIIRAALSAYEKLQGVDLDTVKEIEERWGNRFLELEEPVPEGMKRGGYVVDIHFLLTQLKSALLVADIGRDK